MMSSRRVPDAVAGAQQRPDVVMHAPVTFSTCMIRFLRFCSQIFKQPNAVESSVAAIQALADIVYPHRHRPGTD